MVRRRLKYSEKSSRATERGPREHDLDRSTPAAEAASTTCG
jgi:hypothetical protein